MKAIIFKTSYKTSAFGFITTICKQGVFDYTIIVKSHQPDTYRSKNIKLNNFINSVGYQFFNASNRDIFKINKNLIKLF